MNKAIFYSWQSNLPNKDNRNFIESCLKKGIKNANQGILINYSLDKDTLNKFGSPDIPNTILQKIDDAIYFVADISINENGSPNANVLLELGYAIAKLGWERIICIFNTKYGEVEDLPFDLKFHRILTYHSDVSLDKNKIVKIISETIQNADIIVDGWINSDVLSKQKLDNHIIYILNAFNCIYGYDKYQFLLLNKDTEELSKTLMTRKILGFYVFKKFDDVLYELEHLNSSTDPFFSRRNIKSIIASLILTIKSFEHFCSHRQTPDLFINTNEVDINYKIVHGSELNKENKDGYILFKRHDVNYYQVIDFGNLHSLIQVELSTKYIIIGKKYIDEFVQHTDKIMSVIKMYLNQFDGFLDIDVLQEFDIKKRERIERLTTHQQQKMFSSYSRKEFDLIILKKFPYDDIIIYNFYFNLIKIGMILRNHKELEFNIKTFFQNEFNLEKNIIQPINYEIVSKEEYEKLKKGKLYLVNSIIIPNSTLDFFHIVNEEKEAMNNNYISKMYGDIKYNIFVLLPLLIQKCINDNFKYYSEKTYDLYSNIHNIKVSFYSDFKSIESDVNLFKLYLEQ